VFQNTSAPFFAERNGYNKGGVDVELGVEVGVGVGSAGAGETGGDEVAEAVASLVLASSRSFFSSK